MTEAMKVFLSMSVSGGLLILILLLEKRLLKDKISRQWQYYIWLAVILRLLLPFGPETSLMGTACQAIKQAAPLPPQEAVLDMPDASPAPEAEWTQGSTGGKPLLAAGNTGTQPVQYLWLVWLAAALGLLIRKVTVYQGFIRYLKAGLTPVSDMEMLDLLAGTAERAGVNRAVELCVNPLVSSPLLIGFFHPCIVLPSADVSPTDFQYIVLHELTHCKRGDMFYKWLVQVTVCLHWFNPLVHLMSREITRDCEFSCDEAVLAKMGDGSEQEYGKTLLDAMAAVGKYQENLGAVTLSENKQLLKERLGAIMNFKKKSTAVRILTGVLTACMICGAAFAGVYPTAAAVNHMPETPPAGAGKTTAQKETGSNSSRDSRMAEKYYEAGSLPLFQMVFCRLSEEAQSKWLDRIYADQNIAFMGAAVNVLDEDCAAIQHLAESIYKNGDAAYFSMMAYHMSDSVLESWLDRALEDNNWTIQSVLFNLLDRDEEFDKEKDKWEKEWEETQKKEYGAVGVTVDGKNYYYQGKLVNIFLDIRANKSFYTLNMNPAGTVNIKIVRNADNKITGVAYLTAEEITELFGDDDEDGAEIIPVDLETVAAGETVFLGEYTLSIGDNIWYDISAETGAGMQVYFAKDEKAETVYWSVKNLRQKDEELRCALDTTAVSPAKPGTYKLFLRAVDGALGNVEGMVCITPAEYE